MTNLKDTYKIDCLKKNCKRAWGCIILRIMEKLKQKLGERGLKM